MAYVLFLDDERFPPDDGRNWVVARSSAVALAIIDQDGWPEFISFDHDLGGDDTAMVFIHGILDTLMDQDRGLPFSWIVHSANPVGAENIAGLLCAFERAHPPSPSGTPGTKAG